MPKKPKKRRHKVEEPAKNGEKQRIFRKVAFPLIAVTICITVAITFFSLKPKSKVEFSSPAPVPIAKHVELVKFSRKANSLHELLAMTPEQLREVDIAEVNLLCAAGLPGTKNLDIDRCLARLDEWAAKVRTETNRHLYRVTDPRYADHYRRSESYYRAEMLLQVLQEDCGVKYNPQRIYDVDFTNSKDLFIHGMIDDQNGGTCASMPVLYVAVGRRLGYPLFLSHTKGHLFVRWEDTKDRFNIEGSGNGFSSYPDEYYLTWPVPFNEAEKEWGYFLTTLTPEQEFAAFLAARGHCLVDTGRVNESKQIYLAANKLDPQNPYYAHWATQIDFDRLQYSRQQRVVNQSEKKPIDLYEYVPEEWKPKSPFPNIQPIQPLIPNPSLPHSDHSSWSPVLSK